MLVSRQLKSAKLQTCLCLEVKPQPSSIRSEIHLVGLHVRALFFAVLKGIYMLRVKCCAKTLFSCLDARS